MAAAATSGAPRTPALPPAVALAVRQFRFWLTDYRRTWRGSIYSSVLNPTLYLGAMGLGLGTLVDKHGTAHLGGVSYLMFLAPGLLAAQAMQTGIGECTYPILGSVKWNRTYQAASASPLRPADIMNGHQLFVTMRLLMNCALFFAVMAAFGAVRSATELLAIPAAMLTGLAFATPIEAWAITQNKDTYFSVMFRFVLIPLFLFSGTFFPITQLPVWLRPVAYATPLWHGVALCRGISLGTLTTGDACLHVGYLALVTVAGLIAGRYTHRRRLYA
jgi:lipooligosaccharide transport system permease protein